MTKKDKMPCGCQEQDLRNYYRYYDTPDGCDVFKKTLVTSRYGAMTGFLLGTADILFYSHAVGLVPMIYRYASHMVPLALMGATFSVVANGALNMRKKDDQLNYFLGGMACGPIAAWYLGSKHSVLVGGLALGISGMMKKLAVDSNYTFFPQIPSHMGSIDGWRHDYTLVEDPREVLRRSCGE